MLSPQIEQALSQVENQFDALSAALVSGDLSALEAASNGLRQIAVEFSGFLQNLGPADLSQQDLKRRMKRIAAGLAQQREALIRRSVGIERGLEVLLPTPSSAATYAQASGPYGNGGKSSGAFKLLVA